MPGARAHAPTDPAARRAALPNFRGPVPFLGLIPRGFSGLMRRDTGLRRKPFALKERAHMHRILAAACDQFSGVVA